MPSTIHRGGTLLNAEHSSSGASGSTDDRTRANARFEGLDHSRSPPFDRRLA
jgi:hypothetical protein